MTPTLSSRRILVVDDLAFLRTTVVRILSRLDSAEIVTAKDGGHALGILESGEIDCLVTDYRMPSITGLHLLQRIRTGDVGRRRNLPVVLLTGHAEPMVVMIARSLDVNSVIVKPCSAKVMRQHLEHALTVPIELQAPAVYRQILVPDDTSHGQESEERRPPWLLRDKAPAFRTAAELSPELSARTQGQSPEVSEPTTNADGAAIPRGASVFVPLSELQPGTVIAENLVAQSGIILLTEGTVLSNKIIDRLREIGAEDESLRQVRIYL